MMQKTKHGIVWNSAIKSFKFFDNCSRIFKHMMNDNGDNALPL